MVYVIKNKEKMSSVISIEFSNKGDFMAVAFSNNKTSSNNN